MKFSRKIILKPRDIWWEKNGVFNPAISEYNNKTYMVYRAVGLDHISRFGLAISEDGEHFQVFDNPVLEAGDDNICERLGIEDPRLTKIDNKYYITYTGVSVYLADHVGPCAPSLNTPGVPWKIRVSAYSTTDFNKFNYMGILLKDIDSKNAALLPHKIAGQFALFHRINPNIYLSYSKDLKRWTGNLEIMRSEHIWEKLKVGIACPPIQTDKGWLMIYHGVDEHKVYRMGAALLDLGNPAHVIKRTKHPILEPELAWEKNGFVNNVIFVTGCVQRDDMLWLYYGAADTVVGLVKIPLSYIFEKLDE